MRKDKIRWKHQQDENQRLKMMLKIRERLEVPEPAPELYDPIRVAEEREMIENAIKETAHGGERSHEKLEKDNKYKKYWERHNADKFMKQKTYDLTYARYKDINKNP